MSRTLLLVLSVLIAGLMLQGCTGVPGLGGEFISSGNFTLRSGETVQGDLWVASGNVVLEEGSRVTGSVWVTSGNLNIAGEVAGDLTAVSGNIDLQSSAVVRGNVNTFSGNVNRTPGAEVGGRMGRGVPAMIPFVGGMPWITRLVGFFAQLFFLAILAVVLASIWPQPLVRTADAIAGEPVAVGLVGLALVVGGPILLVVLAITICLAPVSLVGGIALAVAALYGWVAAGLLVGRRLLKESGSQPVIAAVVGTLIVSFVANGIGLIPWAGWLVPALVSVLGLGAVALTRFGSRSYTPGSRPAPPQTPAGTASLSHSS